MDDWLNDALNGYEEPIRLTQDYVGKAEFNRIQGTQLEALRREEFDCFIDYCRGQGHGGLLTLGWQTLYMAGKLPGGLLHNGPENVGGMLYGVNRAMGCYNR